MGRYYADKEHTALRAKANFESALKIDPNCRCAELWLARLQTSTEDAKVRNLEGGTTALKSLWDRSGQRSWRQAYFLYEAYHRGGRSADAEAMWEMALRLAPEEQRDKLRENRAEFLKSREGKA